MKLPSLPLIVALSFAVISICFGCKPTSAGKDKGKLNNIEALQKGDITLRNKIPCGGADLKAPPEEVLKKVYEMVPERLAGQFPLETKIPLGDGKEELIKTIRLSEGEDALKKCCEKAGGTGDNKVLDLKACWVDELIDKTNTRPIVYILKDSEAINSGLLPILALAYSSGFVDRGAKKFESNPEAFKSTLNDGEFLVAFEYHRGNLANNVLAELAPKSEEAAKKFIKEYEVKYPKLAGDLRLQNIIFFEIMDSYYCSPQTFKQFAGLPGTLEAMKPIEALFGPQKFSK